MSLALQDGKFRWNRFDNLLREGSKSQDFDAGQLWLLAGWILSPNAAAVRATLAAEVAKMMDAAAAADVRQRLARRWVAWCAGGHSLLSGAGWAHQRQACQSTCSPDRPSALCLL